MNKIDNKGAECIKTILESKGINLDKRTIINFVENGGYKKIDYLNISKDIIDANINVDTKKDKIKKNTYIPITEEFSNNVINDLEKKLQDFYKIKQKISEITGISVDLLLNKNYREVGVCNVLGKFFNNVRWNTSITGDDCSIEGKFGEIKTKKNKSVSWEFDKQEHQEKRIRTRNINILVCSSFDDEIETSFPDKIYYMNFIDNPRQKNNFVTCISNKQEAYLKISRESGGETTPKRQTISINENDLINIYDEEMFILNRINDEYEIIRKEKK